MCYGCGVVAMLLSKWLSANAGKDGIQDLISVNWLVMDNLNSVQREILQPRLELCKSV